MKTNTLTWAVLILLTLLSFSIGGRSIVWLLLLAAGLKSALVAWRFMELNSARAIWMTALIPLLAGILGTVYFLG